MNVWSITPKTSSFSEYVTTKNQDIVAMHTSCTIGKKVKFPVG